MRNLPTPLQSDDACESVYGIGFVDLPYRPQWLLCAGTGEGLAGDCFGDSGGPLVVGEPGAWLDVGIVIGGDSCAARGYYDLYTHVDQISSFALGRLAPAPAAAQARGGSQRDRRSSSAARPSPPSLRNLRRSGAHVRS